MESRIRQVALNRLVAHPDNPNKMSGSTFAKLVRNIERTGRYEPLIVRPYRRKKGRFQIINGHHRLEAIKKLGHKTAAAIVWDVDDEQTDILLATLNRLSGSDVLAKKIALFKRLTEKMNARQLGRLLPQTPGQIKKLIDLKMPKAPAKALPETLANAMVFFVSDEQKKVVEDALSLAMPTRPATNAAALTAIARHFLDTASQDNTRNEDQIRTA
ncbi:MAG TPA: ParB/RepB/Spo0J family partition protein [Sedimentisphaerales bacterium]|nr:ParB/RepB/Spo0J family partition protein [Sedimentisphaerales bacterium]